MNSNQFWRLTRPRTLTAAFSPVFLGSSFAIAKFPIYHGIFISLLYTILVLITVMSAQIAANIWNEYFDFKSGLDLGQSIGNSGSITRDGINPSTIKKLGIIFTLIPVFTGFPLAFLTSLWLIPVGFICIIISFFYSAGPLPLSRTPLGDSASGITMGFAITLIAAFIWSNTLTTTMLIPAIPSFFLIASILMANNLRDIENDTQHGRHTLAILLGRTTAIRLLQTVFIFCFFWVVFFIFKGLLPITTLLVALFLIPATKAIKTMLRSSEVTSMDKAMTFVAKAVTIYHIGFGIGLLLSLV